MVSQFKSPDDVNLLGNLEYQFPEGTHAIGRLDNHSEGLLLLTTNKKITRLLFLSDIPHKRTYLVQINNVLSEEHLLRLQHGIDIKIKGGNQYTTPPCQVQLVEDASAIYPWANQPGQYGPHTWLLITLTEGKYHQVRKMIGATHHRVKRLIRVSIENLQLGHLPPGSVEIVPEAIFFQLLNIPFTAA